MIDLDFVKKEYKPVVALIMVSIAALTTYNLVLNIKLNKKRLKTVQETDI